MCPSPTSIKLAEITPHSLRSRFLKILPLRPAARIPKVEPKTFQKKSRSVIRTANRRGSAFEKTHLAANFALCKEQVQQGFYVEISLMQEMQAQSLGQEDPEKEMEPYSGILAWEIPWAEEPGWLQSMGSQESDMT